MSQEGKEELLEHTKALSERARRRVRYAGLTGFLFLAVGSLALVGQWGDVSSEDEMAEASKEAPPLDAAQIIAQEFAGKIETGQEPPPSSVPKGPAMPSNEGLASVDEPETTAEAQPEKNASPRAPASVVAPAVKTTALTISLAEGSLKVSKNLDKKKVAKYLDGQLKKGLACGTTTESAKSVKAVFKITKTGSIKDIAVTPKNLEGQIAKCLRKKMGPNPKGLKPKDKAVAEVKLSLKISR